MAKKCQLVAWTEKGQVRMLPSEVTAYLQAERDAIDHLAGNIRYGTAEERGDIFRVSQACEKLAVRLLDLGRLEEAFEQYAQAARYCVSGSEWLDTEWGDVLYKPLRGRFFAMFCTCRDLVRTYPRLQYNWDRSGLQQSFNFVTYPFDCFENNWNDCAGDPDEAMAYTKALRFGKDERYRRRKV